MVGDAAISFRRTDDTDQAGKTKVFITNLSSTPIELRVGYYVIYHNTGDPMNWLCAMKYENGSGHISAQKPDKDAAVLSYGAQHLNLNVNEEGTMEIPKSPMLYIAPAEEIIPDASSALPDAKSSP